MNRSEIANEIMKLEEKQKVMEQELVKMVNMQKQIDELEKMLDILDFEEITKGLDIG